MKKLSYYSSLEEDERKIRLEVRFFGQVTRLHEESFISANTPLGWALTTTCFSNYQIINIENMRQLVNFIKPMFDPLCKNLLRTCSDCSDSVQKLTKSAMEEYKTQIEDFTIMDELWASPDWQYAYNATLVLESLTALCDARNAVIAELKEIKTNNPFVKLRINWLIRRLHG